MVERLDVLSEIDDGMDELFSFVLFVLKSERTVVLE